MKARDSQAPDSGRYIEAIIEGQGFDPESESILFQVDCPGIAGKERPQAFVVSAPVKQADWVKLTMVRLSDDKSFPGRLILINGTEIPCTVRYALGDSHKTILSAP